MKKLITIFLFFPFIAWAQIPISDGGTVMVDCAAGTVDITNINYGPGENYSITICPQDGNYIEFNTGISGGTASWDVAAGDFVFVYDGMDDTAPLVGMYGIDDEFGFNAASTLDNASGCLTIVFVSAAGSPGAAGFTGTVSCATIGQPFFTEITSDPPAVDGYIDICVGETVTFTANTNYVYDGQGYDQSDVTSTFTWDFGTNGEQEGVAMTSASATFDLEVGTQVDVTVVDVFGQESVGSIKVRVSTTPNFGGVVAVFQDTICLGNSSTLIGTIPADEPDSLGVAPTEGSFVISGSFDNPLALPDGGATDPDNPEYYNTIINFDDFPEGSTLDNIDDLLSICVNMNHTYTSDLEMWLVCPGGDTLVLFDAYFDQASGVGLFPGGVSMGGTNLGNPPTEGYTYCFTASADESFEGFDANPVPTVPEGDYLPMSDITNLEGCPLNGDWTLFVGDYFGADEGNIYGWSINFASTINPDIETYTPILTDGYWENTDEDIINVTPTTVGNFDYTYIVEDNFGCTHDTTVVLTVVDPSSSNIVDPACFYTSDLVVNNSLYGGVWEYETDVDGGVATFAPDSVIVNASGLYTFSYTDNLCQWTDVHHVTFLPLATADLPDTMTICEEEPVLISALPQAEGIINPIYSWTSSGQVLVPGNEPSQYVQQPGIYTFSVYDPTCDYTAFATFELFTKPCVIETYNVFTPNGDGENDVFYIKAIREKIYDGSELFVYNRWGNLIYEAVNYTNDWKMDDIEDGTYYFVLNTTDGKKHTGSFTVIR